MTVISDPKANERPCLGWRMWDSRMVHGSDTTNVVSESTRASHGRDLYATG